MGVLAGEACRRAAVPLIVHFHGYDASVYSVLEEHAKTYPVMFKQAAAVIAVSRSMQKKLISLGASPAKVHYNPYGVDCERVRRRRSRRCATDIYCHWAVHRKEGASK